MFLVDGTDYLIRYTTATFSPTTAYYQIPTVVGIELGREDGKGQGGLCVGDTGRHDRCGLLEDKRDWLYRCVQRREIW